ncbi:DNA-binding transcriptional ArsR family regulator [Lewinella marina]|uniref:Transcriptional regulator n=1 Tax=Neolewinella marina TaxID=438751 RepID=A0A2G0CHN5_9BACT|nr:metalloregulator ArsR/SmtB family transcription factor [Neolewinella marina]NJB86092.1 DNA-binding transcriptional ArsR family regulator [Neolewinella marina]PHK99430.1 transcriptional regulator [Neolewinella marina]
MGVTKTEAYTEPQLEMAALFRALGHPARIAILEKLLEVDCCICRDLTDCIDLSQPTLSRHLRELQDVGLIEDAVAGTTRRYRIAPHRWREVQGLTNALFAAFRDGGC